MSLIAIPVFAAHLLCMNVAAAGPLLCVWLDRGVAGEIQASGEAARWLARKSWQLALLGALLGLIYGWLRWNPEYAEVIGHFRRRIHWGGAEFLFSLGLVYGYERWLVHAPTASGIARGMRSLVALLAATNLLYHFPTLFSLIAGMSAGRFESRPVDSATFRKLIVNQEVWALTCHFLCASIAVSAAALLWRASRLPGPSNSDAAVSVRLARAGLVATLGQIPIGLWLISAIPADRQQRLMGGDLITSALFVLSMVASFSLLHLLGAVSFGDTSTATIRRLNLLLTAVVVGMAGVLYRLNH